MTMGDYLSANAAARGSATKPSNGAMGGSLQQYYQGAKTSFADSLSGLQGRGQDQPSFADQIKSLYASGPKSFNDTLSRYQSGGDQQAYTRPTSIGTSSSGPGGSTLPTPTTDPSFVDSSNSSIPWLYRRQSPLENYIRKNLSSFTLAGQSGDPSASGQGSEFGAWRNARRRLSTADPGASPYTTDARNVEMRTKLGLPFSQDELQPGDSALKGQIAANQQKYQGMMTPEWWQTNPELWRDQLAYMSMRTPSALRSTEEVTNRYELMQQTPEARAGQIAASGGKKNVLGINMSDASEAAAKQAAGLYAMGMPGTQPYVDWFNDWDTTPPPTHYTTGQAASPILDQIRNTGKINRRDFAPQGQTPIPSVAPATTPTFTPAFQATPDRSARVAAPSANLRPDAYYAQAPTRRYGLKSSGGSPLLDAMMNPKPLFGV